MKSGEIAYIKKEFNYAKTIFITKYYIDFISKDEQSIIQNISDIKDILKTSTFNCVLRRIHLAIQTHKHLAS